MYESEKEMMNMASKNSTTTKLILKVYKTDSSDPEKTIQRTFNHINPDISDDVIYTIGNKLAGLQSHGLVSVLRNDSSVIAE